jgi:hypothetical protein
MATNIEINKIIVGSYDSTVISESPKKVKVFGEYNTSKAPSGGGGDALHSFESRVKDTFGGRMNTAVNKELKDFYAKGLNPNIESITIDMGSTFKGPIVKWEVIISESTDGKAWIGLTSRGGASETNESKSSLDARINKLVSDKKTSLPGENKEKGPYDFKTILDYFNPKGSGKSGIRQVFFAYTRPDSFPPLGSGSSGTSGSAGTSGTSGSAGTSGTSGVNDKLITGKIIITKKSGPGEITGVTVADLAQVRNLDITNAEFKSEVNTLQFTEPGDYVLSITCTNDKVEPYELKVKVTKEDDIIAQPESKGGEPEKKPVDGTRPIIAQIDKPTIRVRAIKIDRDKTSPDQDSYTKGLGYTPLISYKTHAIEDRSLKSMRLFHDGLIPMIEFTFEDTKEILKGETTPKDDATIDLFLNSTSKNLKSIHMVFKIKGFVQGTQKASQTYTITGTANIPRLYVQNNKSYNGTSFDTLRKICKHLDIGFNSNIKDTNDSMSWRNTNKKPYEFMDEIISRSYINDESYMAGYIDYYYCFNYVDLEKEMNRDASNDLGLDSSAMAEQSKSDEIERLVSLRLTNEQSQNASSNFIGSYTTLNESTKKSLQEGYATITKTYDRNTKSFLVFTVDSTTSDGVESHILKGAEFDDKYQKENVKHKFLGKIDTDNVHANYNYAVTQNRINLNNLNKIVLNATLPNANWNLYKFMKIAVDLVNPSSTPTNPSVRDFRYSGYYIIADIEYFWNGKSMSQKLRLVKKELGKTPDEIRNDPPPQKKPEVKENNTNPTGTASIVPAPNSVYNVGQTYLVQDKSGKLYNLTVTSLLENGIEVSGTLKESPIGLSSSTTSNTTALSNSTGTTQSTTTATTGGTPSAVLIKPFNNANEVKNFQDWLDSNYPTWLKNGKLNKGAGYGNYGTNTENAYKAYGSIYSNYLSSKGMSQSTS